MDLFVFNQVTFSINSFEIRVILIIKALALLIMLLYVQILRPTRQSLFIEDSTTIGYCAPLTGTFKFVTTVSNIDIAAWHQTSSRDEHSHYPLARWGYHRSWRWQDLMVLVRVLILYQFILGKRHQLRHAFRDATWLHTWLARDCRSDIYRTKMNIRRTKTMWATWRLAKPSRIHDWWFLRELQILFGFRIWILRRLSP